jgi:hypothetical protein
MYFLIFCNDNNKIRAKGVEYISKTNWYDLTRLNLSIIIILWRDCNNIKYAGV